MRPPPSKLANCYIPLPWKSVDEPLSVTDGRIPNGRLSLSSESVVLATARKSSRASHALRRLRTETTSTPSTPSTTSSSIEGKTDASTTTTPSSPSSLPGHGCAWVEWGETKVMCQVVAPLVDDGAAADESEGATVDGGTLRCDVQWAGGAFNGSAAAAFAASDVMSSTDAGGSSGGTTGRFGAWNARREGQLRRHLRDVLAPAIPLRQYAKCAIRITVTILHDDAGLLPACVLAVTLALQDAAIEMYDTVTCCRVAVLRSRDGGTSDMLLADPDLAEEEAAMATVTVAWLPALKEVALWHQSGSLPPSTANDALALCLDGCRTLHRFVQQHWRDASYHAPHHPDP